jgi:hypothetical protein
MDGASPGSRELKASRKGLKCGAKERVTFAVTLRMKRPLA